MALTKEFINGQWVTVDDQFRAYGSPSESSADYWRLISTAPRYQGVTQAPDLESAIEAMGGSGYATDPDYARKLRAFAPKTDSQQQYIAQREQELLAAGATPVVASLGARQSALETGWGRSRAGSNNLYGIKAPGRRPAASSPAGAGAVTYPYPNTNQPSGNDDMNLHQQLLNNVYSDVFGPNGPQPQAPEPDPYALFNNPWFAGGAAMMGGPVNNAVVAAQNAARSTAVLEAQLQETRDKQDQRRMKQAIADSLQRHGQGAAAAAIRLGADPAKLLMPKAQEPTSDIQNYQYLVSQGVPPEQALAAFGTSFAPAGTRAPAAPSGYQWVDPSNPTELQPIPGGPPAVEREQAVGRLQQAMTNIDKLKGLITENGSTILFGPESGQAGQLRSSIIADVAVLRNMGVLQPGELDAIEATLVDPTKFSSMLTWDEKAQEQYTTLRSQFEERLRQMNRGLTNPGANNPGANNPGAHNPSDYNPGEALFNPGSYNPGRSNPGAPAGAPPLPPNGFVPLTGNR